MSDENSQDIVIGDRVDGRELVCRGDDRPDEFVDWLEILSYNYMEIAEKAEELDIKLISPKNNTHIASLTSFYRELGIEVDGRFWEGDHVSGTFITGWLPIGGQKKSEALGRELIDYLSSTLKTTARDNRISQLLEIDDFDEFLTAVENFDGELTRRALKAEESLTEALEKTKILERHIHKLKAEVAKLQSSIDLDCMKILSAVLEGRKEPLVAGPVFLWDDGSVYAMTSLGGVDLPENSSPAILIRALEACGKPLVRVQEMTVIGGWIRGPTFAKGSSDINDWLDVWTNPPKQSRTFKVEPASAYDQLVLAADTISGNLV